MPRRLIATAVAALALAGLLAGLSRPSTEAVASTSLTDGPSPMQSRRARASAPPSVPSLAEADDDEAVDTAAWVIRREMVVVELRASTRGLRTFPRTARLDPTQFWPLPGESPLPEGAVADGLQAMLADAEDAPDERDWVLDALDAGADSVDPAADPWGAVLALEVERRAARLAWDDTYSEASASLPEGTMVAQRALIGAPDVDALLDLADGVIEAWPDAAVAEYARLYLLDGLQSAGAEGDLDQARDLALDLLRHTDDALVAGQAVSLLTRLPRTEPIPADDLDALEALVDGFPDTVAGIDVAAFALDQALRSDDGERAARWTDRLDDALHAGCDLEAPGPVCATHLSNRDEVVGLLGDRSAAEAATWRQALEIAAYACDREFRARTGDATLTWDGGWAWAWRDGEDRFTECMEAEAAGGPGPDAERLVVALRVVGRPKTRPVPS